MTDRKPPKQGSITLYGTSVTYYSDGEDEIVTQSDFHSPFDFHLVRQKEEWAGVSRGGEVQVAIVVSGKELQIQLPDGNTYPVTKLMKAMDPVLAVRKPDKRLRLVKR